MERKAEIVVNQLLKLDYLVEAVDFLKEEISFCKNAILQIYNVLCKYN